MKNSSHLKLRALCEGAIFVALAQVLGYIKLFELPQGGSVGIGMLPIFIYCARWGFGPGMLASIAYSVLQLLLDGAYAWGWQSILGRYVLTPAIFDILEHTAPGRNNEIQLTDGMKELCRHEPMCAVDFEGRRYDTGNLKGYLESIIDFALKNDEAGEWLRQFIIDKAETLK